MKRIGNIYYSEFCTRENIRCALHNAMAGKDKYPEVRKIRKDPELYVEKLYDILKNRKYKNSEYTIMKRKTGGKEREIFKLPFFPDRVVHHCIINVLGQTWKQTMIHDTFSTIPGRGAHTGAERLKKAVIQPDAKYCLKIDIKKYYPSINNEILKTIITKKIKDKYLLELMFSMIDTVKGVPIGNYDSQWYGNLYTAYFDHWCKETLGIKYYYRYCDDIVIIGKSKEQLWQWFFKIKNYLESELKLNIRTYDVFEIKSRGIDYMGYRFFPGYTLIRKRIIKAMKQNLDKPKSKASYFGWLVHADSYRLIKKYFRNEPYAIKKYPGILGVRQRGAA